MKTKRRKINAATWKPKSLYRLLKLALEDFKVFRKTHPVNMRRWMQFFNAGAPCAGCVAGAMLFQSCGIRSFSRWNRTSIPKWACAVDDLRSGDIHFAAMRLGIPRADWPQTSTWDVANYDIDPDKFLRDMESLLAYLKDHEAHLRAQKRKRKAAAR